MDTEARIVHYTCQNCHRTSQVAQAATEKVRSHPPMMPRCLCGGKWTVNHWVENNQERQIVSGRVR